MSKIKILISVFSFSILLIGISIIKNQTRELEKKIYNISKIIHVKEKDINESQLDFSYLTSPSIIEMKIEHLDNKKYKPMDYSNIFLSLSNYIDLQNKYVIQKKTDEKKIQKK